MENTLSNLEKQKLVKLFNKSGWVLDFSNSTFETFTKASVGIDVQAEYGGSKGASLERFIFNGQPDKVIKLIKDLIDYYPLAKNYERERAEDKTLFDNCVKFMETKTINSYETLTKEFAVKVNSEYITQQLDLMTKSQKDNPTEVIGKAKELVESCCKTILDNVGESYSKDDNLNALVDKTINKLNLSPKCIKDTVKASETIKKILGNMKSIAIGLAELRNPYGSGHGKSASFKGLEERHAKLAIGSAMTLVNFLWDSYELQYCKGEHK